MNTYPYQISPQEPTQKQLWLAAYTALLHRLSPAEAIKAADEALALCNERWSHPPYVTCWQYKHNYAVGHAFPNKEVPPQKDCNP